MRAFLMFVIIAAYAITYGSSNAAAEKASPVAETSPEQPVYQHDLEEIKALLTIKSQKGEHAEEISDGVVPGPPEKKQTDKH